MMELSALRILSEYGHQLIGVTGGSYLMGGGPIVTERLIRRVNISDFDIARFPVTNLQYDRFLGELSVPEQALYIDNHYVGDLKSDKIKEFKREHNKDLLKPRRDEDLSNHPVVNVSWHDAQRYCNWLGSKTGLTVGLPTEAQWEYAASGPERFRYTWGNTWDSNQLTFKAIRTTPVDAHPQGASWCGVEDMLGNTWEWVSDKFKPYSPDDTIDPRGPKGSGAEFEFKVLRGSYFSMTIPDLVGCWHRNLELPREINSAIGFRIAVISVP